MTRSVFMLFCTGAVFSVAAAGCGGTKLKPRCVQGSGSACEVASTRKEDDSAAQPSGDPLKQATSVIEELRLLEAWNQGLCQRVNRHIVECPAAAPLVPTASNATILNCSAAAGGAKVERTFQAVIDAGASSESSIPVSLHANSGMFRTDALTGTSAQTMTWRSLGSGSTESPRFLDLMSLQLVDEEGRTAGNFNLDYVRSFELRIDDEVVATKADLIPVENGKGVALSQNRLDALRKGPECLVPAGEIEELRTKAKEDLAKATTSTVKVPQTAAEARSQLPSLQDNLERERSRNKALQNVLGQDANRGCWADAAIKTLEIVIDGGPGGDNGEIAREKTSQPLESSGSPNSYTIQLGDLLKLSGNNDADSSLFRSGGKLIKSDFDSQTVLVGELRYLKVTRGGVAYAASSSQKCDSGVFGIGGGCDTKWFNRETGVTSLQRLRILVNGQVAYDRDGINHTFNRDSLEFTDTALRNNRAWLALMARQDCGVTSK
jgi:hypothetical protein